jgi:uncharacterized protein (TIGR02145 family)
MAENLNYAVEGSKCYNDSISNCDKYGRLYDFDMAQNACPSGWHLPNNAEWDVLIAAVGGNETAGKHLKATDGWINYTGIVYEDIYGFTALSGGLYSSRSNRFALSGYDCYWWSASEYDTDNAYRHYMSDENELVSRIYNYKTDLLSVRCVKGDAPPTPSSSSSSDVSLPSSSSNISQSSSSSISVSSSSGTATGGSSSSSNAVVEYILCINDGSVPPYINGCTRQCAREQSCCWAGEFSRSTGTVNLSCEESKAGIGACGSQKYDSKTQFCSDGTLYDLCDGKSYNLTNQRCGVGDVVETKCGNGWYNPDTQFCSDGTLYDLCDGKSYNPTNQFCYEDKLYDLCNNETYNPETQFCSNSVVKTKDTFTDDRDGQTYTYVVIDNQTWMAKNLNYAVEGSKCYDNLEINCDIYGRLYNWETAKTVCPSGWHIPNDSDWNELMTAVGGSSTAGKHLKATAGWSSCSASGSSYSCLDSYGFSALPGGNGSSNGGFSDVGNIARFWSATEGTAGYAWYRHLSYGNEYVNRIGYDKSNLFSVRCVQDTP